MDKTSIVQDGFSYNQINPQVDEEFISGTGTISVSRGTCAISIGTTLYDYALLRCKEVIRYRVGIPLIVNFSAKYSTGVANSLQMCGVGTSMYDIYFGYNGTNLSCRVSKDGAHDIRTLTLTASASGSETFTLTLNDTVYNGSLTNETVDFNAFEIENANVYTGFTVQKISNTIVFLYTQVGVRSGTFSFSSTGTCAGTFSVDSVGSALTTTNVDSTSWNGVASAIRRLDPQDWNMYQIEYGSYGVSNIIFKVFNTYTNIYDTLHTMRLEEYPDTGIGVETPSLYVQRFVSSLGSTTALSMEVSGIHVQYEGSLHKLIQPRYVVTNERVVGVSTETVLLGLTHRSSLNGIPCVEDVNIQSISVSNSGTQMLLVRVYKNPSTISAETPEDFLNFVEVHSNSITVQDVTSLTSTGGSLQETFMVDPATSTQFCLVEKELFLHRADVLVITCESGATSTVSLSVSFIEDI